MTERTLPIFLLVAAAIVAVCIWLGVWWLAIPIVAILLPGPFVTPAIVQKLALKRRGASFQRNQGHRDAGFTDEETRTLT
ncbi:MAG: hypothetical protein H0U42_02810 [Thermoleophilaceae bacterium]|nr:hypothetical protein [Thermoleophilaceae bacterium]